MCVYVSTSVFGRRLDCFLSSLCVDVSWPLFLLFCLLPTFHRLIVVYVFIFVFTGKSTFAQVSRAEVRLDCRNDSHCGWNVLKRSRFELGCRGLWRNRGGGVWTWWGRRSFWRLDIFLLSYFIFSVIMVIYEEHFLKEGCEIFWPSQKKNLCKLLGLKVVWSKQSNIVIYLLVYILLSKNSVVFVINCEPCCQILSKMVSKNCLCRM